MTTTTNNKQPLEQYMKNRAQELLGALNPNNNNSSWMVNITGGEFNSCDPSIDIEGISIYTSDDMPDLYQVAKSVRVPGRMYYPDGSGQPDSDELVDIGQPHKGFDNAFIEACKLLVEARLHGFLDAEADVEEYEEAYRDHYEVDQREVDHECGWQLCENRAEYVRDTPWGDLPVCGNHLHTPLFD